MDRTYDFFERYAALAILVARFVPAVRAFVPFPAGVGSGTTGGSSAITCSGGGLVRGARRRGDFFGTMPVANQDLDLLVCGVMALTAGSMLHVRLRTTPVYLRRHTV